MIHHLPTSSAKKQIGAQLPNTTVNLTFEENFADDNDMALPDMRMRPNSMILPDMRMTPEERKAWLLNDIMGTVTTNPEESKFNLKGDCPKLSIVPKIGLSVAALTGLGACCWVNMAGKYNEVAPSTSYATGNGAVHDTGKELRRGEMSFLEQTAADSALDTIWILDNFKSIWQYGTYKTNDGETHEIPTYRSFDGETHEKPTGFNMLLAKMKSYQRNEWHYQDLCDIQRERRVPAFSGRLADLYKISKFMPDASMDKLSDKFGSKEGNGDFNAKLYIGGLRNMRVEVNENFEIGAAMNSQAHKFNFSFEAGIVGFQKMCDLAKQLHPEGPGFEARDNYFDMFEKDLLAAADELWLPDYTGTNGRPYLEPEEIPLFKGETQETSKLKSELLKRFLKIENRRYKFTNGDLEKKLEGQLSDKKEKLNEYKKQGLTINQLAGLGICDSDDLEKMKTYGELRECRAGFRSATKLLTEELLDFLDSNTQNVTAALPSLKMRVEEANRQGMDATLKDSSVNDWHIDPPEYGYTPDREIYNHERIAMSGEYADNVVLRQPILTEYWTLAICDDAEGCTEYVKWMPRMNIKKWFEIIDRHKARIPIIEKYLGTFHMQVVDEMLMSSNFIEYLPRGFTKPFHLTRVPCRYVHRSPINYKKPRVSFVIAQEMQ